jgi:hypothetical protein
MVWAFVVGLFIGGTLGAVIVAAFQVGRGYDPHG